MRTGSASGPAELIHEYLDAVPLIATGSGSRSAIVSPRPQAAAGERFELRVDDVVAPAKIGSTLQR